MTVHSADNCSRSLPKELWEHRVSPKTLKNTFQKAVTPRFKNNRLKEHPSRGNDIWEVVGVRNAFWSNAGGLEWLGAEGWVGV